MIYVFLITSHNLLALSRDNGNQPNTNQLRKQDKLEEYLYARLDAFLAQPTPDQLNHLESIEDSLWRPIQSPAEQLAYVILKSNEGYYQLRFNQVTKAISAYENAWKIYDNNDLEGFDIVEYCLKPLGNAYSMLGDFESAENIVKSYLLEARKNSEPGHFASAVINLSIIYYSTGRFNEAISILSEGLNATELPESKKSLFYANLAKNYLKTDQIDKALEMSNNALKYCRQYPVWNVSEHLISIYSTLSILNKKSNELPSALQNIQIANDIADTSQIVKPRTKAKIKIQQAGVLSGMGRQVDALQTYKNTLVQLINGYDDTSVLPAKQLLYPENTLKEALDGMALIYTKTDSLQLAYKCYELSFEVENLLRSGYNYREAKYLQQQENRARAEKVILLLIEMHSRYGNKQYIKRAFEIAENTKSLVLKSVYQNQQYWDYVANDSLSQIQKDLNYRKAQLQNAIIQERLKGDEANLNRIEQLIDQQNQLMIEMKALRSSVNDLPFEKGILTDSLQKLLSDRKETMIQYFWGDNHLFRFVLNGKNIMLHRLDEVKSMKEDVRNFLSFLDDPNKINNSYQAYAELAFSLYNQLLPKGTDNGLIIVPDGILNFIPFEGLVYEIPKNAQYSQWSWVLNKYPIAYRSSAAEVLSNKEDKNNFGREILGVFPEFEGSREHLMYSANEYEGISDFFNGKYLLKSKATKAAFLKNIADYPVIHLSTHANAGDLNRPPSIAFIDSSLFLPEIYGLDVDNKLMVLSACETGLGKLHTGESAISLANGFVQVGVDNIVFSLWSVNDFSTSELMSDFYRHFSESEPVSLSLRHAKQDYLKNENVSANNKSPYYWASFVYYGDTQIKSNNDSKSFLIMTLSGIGLLVLGCVFFWIRKRSGNTRRNQQ